MKTALKLVIMFLIMAFVFPCVGIYCGKSRKIVGTWEASTGCGPVQITFNKDGAGSMTGFAGPQSFKWRIDGDEIVVQTEGSRKEDRMRFELEENTLTLHTDDGPITLRRLR